MNTKPRPFARLTFLALLAVWLPAVAQDTYGPVRPGESLWVIAGKVYPGQPVTRDQGMLALLKANPQAFGVSCNANSVLKTGSLLQVPPVKEVTALSSAEAQRELRRQLREWNAHKRTGKPLTCPPMIKAVSTPAATTTPAQQAQAKPSAMKTSPSKPSEATPPPEAAPTPPKPSATRPEPTTPSKPNASAPAPTTLTHAAPTPSATTPGPAAPSHAVPTPPKRSTAASAPTAPAESPPTPPPAPAKAPAPGAPAQTAAPPTSELAVDGLVVAALLLGGLLLLVDLE
jgi:FimV-like protein